MDFVARASAGCPAWAASTPASESAALAVPPHAERHRVGVRPQRAGYLREAAAVGTRSGMRALSTRRACSVLVFATSPGASLSPSVSPGASGVLGMPASP